jgi:hypothetical protein
MGLEHQILYQLKPTFGFVFSQAPKQCIVGGVHQMFFVDVDGFGF